MQTFYFDHLDNPKIEKLYENYLSEIDKEKLVKIKKMAKERKKQTKKPISMLPMTLMY